MKIIKTVYSRFINKEFNDVNEINLYMDAHPTYRVYKEVTLNGKIYITFKV